MTPEAVGSRKQIDSVDPFSTAGINFDEILKRHAKGDKEFRGSFGLLQTRGRGHHAYADLGEIPHVSTLYMYREEGFVINATSDNGYTAVVCAVSYDLSPLPSDDRYNHIKDDDARKYPRIVQMQGCTRPKGDAKARRPVVMEALSTFSLEDVLLDLVIAQAQQKHLPAVAILPAHANPQLNIEGYRIDKAEQRFDGTATRRGFRQNENGLWVMELI